MRTTIFYQNGSWFSPAMSASEKKFLVPIFFGSSVLFLFGVFFSYQVLAPAAFNFFLTFADGVVESLWSIDQYFDFIFILMLSTGICFQLPVVQIILSKTGLLNSKQMLDNWRFVVLGAMVIAGLLT